MKRNLLTSLNLTLWHLKSLKELEVLLREHSKNRDLVPNLPSVSEERLIPLLSMVHLDRRSMRPSLKCTWPIKRRRKSRKKS